MWKGSMEKNIFLIQFLRKHGRSQQYFKREWYNLSMHTIQNSIIQAPSILSIRDGGGEISCCNKKTGPLTPDMVIHKMLEIREIFNRVSEIVNNIIKTRIWEEPQYRE